MDERGSEPVFNFGQRMEKLIRLFLEFYVWALFIRKKKEGGELK